jgi:ABC-type glycerol-3-phosphate transport system permease component
MKFARRATASRPAASEEAPLSRGPFQIFATAAIWVWVAFNALLLIWVAVASLKDSTEIFSQTKAFSLPSAPQWALSVSSLHLH